MIALAIRNWKLVLGGLAIAALGLMLLIAKADARHWEKRFNNEHEAHLQTVANYRAAADEARRLDAANVARAKTEQQAITERTVDALKSRAADTDARYQRLLANAKAYADSSGGRDPAVSGAGDTACRAYAGADCAAIPALLKAAQDNTDQLVALQSWARDQSKVTN